MVTAVLIDEIPLAFVGARHWYPTVAMLELDADERATVQALCETLVGSDTTETTPRAVDP